MTRLEQYPMKLTKSSAFSNMISIGNFSHWKIIEIIIRKNLKKS